MGVRPPQWVGELVQKDDGSVEDLRPQAVLSVQEGGQQLEDAKLYRDCLPPDEIEALYKAGRSISKAE